MPEAPLSLLRELFNRTREVISKRPIGVSSYAADDILRAGRFKTQFEPGTESNGTHYPELRRNVEQYLLALPPSLPVEQRPVYGALRAIGPDRDALVRRLASGSFGPPSLSTDPLRAYGDWTYLLSPEAKARSTFTLGDSLEADTTAGRRRRTVAYPFNQPLPQQALHRLIQYTPPSIPPRVSSDFLDNLNPNMLYDYVETQTPGPLSLKEVSAIIRRLPRPNDYYSLGEHAQALDRSEQTLHRYQQEVPRIPIYNESRVLEDDDLARHLQLKARGGLVSALRGH